MTLVRCSSVVISSSGGPIEQSIQQSMSASFRMKVQVISMATPDLKGVDDDISPDLSEAQTDESFTLVSDDDERVL